MSCKRYFFICIDISSASLDPLNSGAIKTQVRRQQNFTFSFEANAGKPMLKELDQDPVWKGQKGNTVGKSVDKCDTTYRGVIITNR
jgi:hypothetical protein